MGHAEQKHIPPVDTPEIWMVATHCPICENLEAAVGQGLANTRSRSAQHYRVSTELVACKNVEMERAKSELEEHRLVCTLQPES